MKRTTGVKGTKRMDRVVSATLAALLAFGTAVGAFGCALRQTDNYVKEGSPNAIESGSASGYTSGYTSGYDVSGMYYATESYAVEAGGYQIDDPIIIEIPWNTEEYNVITEHGFTSVLSKPFSTFSADIDTASYCNLRRMIRDGYLLDEIPAGAVRIEEMLNYFTYSYAAPGEGLPAETTAADGSELFGVTATISTCPWNPDTKLLVIGLQAKEAQVKANTGNNLVFLIDVSGSMATSNKLPLLQQSFAYLLDNLGENDTVSIVTYASGEQVVLQGAKASERERILEALNGLDARGATNGQAGLAMAYDVASRYFVEGGNNRIILASDGDLNVGITSMSDLEEYVAGKRDSGIYLSVLGFGDGNFKDTKMETIADAGNGAYYYIDCIEEAERIFGEQLTRTMYAVANDVKFQLEFNPAYVKGYRQVGYENRELSDDEFTDDKVDAGEVGSGAQITVAYELVTVDSAMQLFTAESRYGAGNAGVENGEWLALSVRYKEPGATSADAAQASSYVIGESACTETPGEDWMFAAQVIEFGMILRGSENVGTATLDGLQREVLSAGYTDERRVEFAKLVNRVM